MEMQPVNPTENQDDQLAKIMAIAKVYFWELLKFSWLIVGLAAALGWYMRKQKLKDPTVFTATVTFMLNEDENKQQNVLENFLGFGNSAAPTPDLNKIDELMNTRKLIQLTLFSEVTMADSVGTPKKDLMINHYLEKFGIRKEWRDNGAVLADIYFEVQDTQNYIREIPADSIIALRSDTSMLARRKNSILLTVFGQISRLYLKKYITSAGIVNMSFESPSEEFSQLFILKLYSRLNTYYTAKTIERQRLVAQKTTERKRKLSDEVSKAEGEYAGYLKENQYYTNPSVEIKTMRKRTKLENVTQAYIASIQSDEAAQFALERQYPVMQLIDPPILPLPVIRPNPFLHMLIGGVIGGFLGVLFVIAQKFARDFFFGKKKPTTDDTTNA